MQIAKKAETDEQRKRRLNTESIRKEIGTAGHNTLEDLIELYGNGKGSRAQILKNSPFNEFQFKRIEDGAKELIKQAKAQQENISAHESFLVRVSYSVHATHLCAGIVQSTLYLKELKN